MSKEAGSNFLAVIPRESLQTPSGLQGRDLASFSITDPTLEGPCELNMPQMEAFISELEGRQDLFLELSNSMSGPTVAKNNRRLLDKAHQHGVSDRVPVHTRMTLGDFKLALDCGATRAHLFGNSSNVAEINGHAKTPEYWISQMQDIAQYGSENGVSSIRGSLEHATQTDPERIIQFIEGIQAINSQLQTRIINTLGLPDTNGQATPNDYTAILNNIRGALQESGLMFSIHLHDDSGYAMENALVISEFCDRYDILVLLETIDPYYPGERVGIRPTFNQLPSLGIEPLPHTAFDLVKGNTWVSEEQDLNSPFKRKEAVVFHVAGVHTKAIANYQNGHIAYPQPGLYQIMGKHNFEFLAGHMGLQLDGEIIQETAIIGRELAAQYGNLPQGYAVELIKLAARDSDVINQAVEVIGPAEEWLERPIPDLAKLKERLDEAGSLFGFPGSEILHQHVPILGVERKTVHNNLS